MRISHGYFRRRKGEEGNENVQKASKISTDITTNNFAVHPVNKFFLKIWHVCLINQACKFVLLSIAIVIAPDVIAPSKSESLKIRISFVHLSRKVIWQINIRIQAFVFISQCKIQLILEQKMTLSSYLTTKRNICSGKSNISA